jgi:transcriptional regulator with XRE-family HTH domain
MPRRLGSHGTLVSIDGERVQELRVGLDLSQEEVAGRAEISKGYVSQIETGKIKRISMKASERLASALDVEQTEITRQDPVAAAARSQILRFTGIGLNDATAADLARELQQVNAYTGRITRALQSKLR